jgi:serine acetyltransferase
MSGVKIGDGAVIANNSHVINDIDPYSLVGGNPAKHIKSRFKKPQIEALLKIQWWNWSDEKINKYVGLLMNPDVDNFIRAVQADNND